MELTKLNPKWNLHLWDPEGRLRRHSDLLHMSYVHPTLALVWELGGRFLQTDLSPHGPPGLRAVQSNATPSRHEDGVMVATVR